MYLCYTYLCKILAVVLDVCCYLFLFYKICSFCIYNADGTSKLGLLKHGLLQKIVNHPFSFYKIKIENERGGGEFHLLSSQVPLTCHFLI